MVRAASPSVITSGVARLDPNADQRSLLRSIQQALVSIQTFEKQSVQFQRQLLRLLGENPMGFGLPFLFGDGNLGDVTVSGSTTVSSQAINQYRNLNVASGGTLTTTETSTAVMILLVSEALNVVGTIDVDNDGGAGSSSGSPGNDATDYTSSRGAAGGGGGSSSGSSAGGAGGSTIVSGGAGGTGASGTGGTGSALATSDVTGLRMRQDFRDFSLISWGAGGAGGGGGGIPGDGGNGGGCILIIANQIVISSTGVITADGQVGETNGSTAGGGGGGGGGLIYIISRSITNDGSIAAAAGAGGGSGTGGAGGPGAAGSVIQEVIP